MGCFLGTHHLTGVLRIGISSDVSIHVTLQDLIEKSGQIKECPVSSFDYQLRACLFCPEGPRVHRLRPPVLGFAEARISQMVMQRANGVR